jgi:hypothetical protein
MLKLVFETVFALRLPLSWAWANPAETEQDLNYNHTTVREHRNSIEWAVQRNDEITSIGTHQSIMQYRTCRQC